MNNKKIIKKGRKVLAGLVITWLFLLSPAVALADEGSVDATGSPTGAGADTGAPDCTGAGCGQGADQGTNQGQDQGGPSAEDLGADAEGNLPEGVEDTRQGASQGTTQGSAQGSDADISGTNSNTGAGSGNEVGVNTDDTATTNIDNTVNDVTDVDAVANTGGNSQNKNTSVDGITSGNASIGVTQVKNDNTATIGGDSGLNVLGHNGDYEGDLILEFGAALGQLTGSDGGSVRAVNDTTGSDSANSVNVDTSVERINEVQNDGVIDNLLNLQAITGQNEANKNTSDGLVATGDANIAATLVNLLNTTVINGGLWLTVADIFGDLTGNVVLPEFSTLAAAAGFGGLDIDVSNDGTGADSNNEINIDMVEEEATNIDNEADINTTVNAEAITGQNKTMSNTGGGSVTTGDGSVSASNISIANTTIEGGNWGLVVVNALNSWLGFLVGDSGEVRQLSQNETLREIEAHNSDTGSNSDNTIDINDEASLVTNVENNAVINNEVNATAITGQNEANKNTGQGLIDTGDANVEVTAVNIANTTVKDGSLFIAVVNVFGDWFGDLMYGESSVLASAGAGQLSVNVDATNSETGAESNNDIDIEVSRSHETNVDNEADIDTVLNANIDTGNNRANRNTLGGNIETGDGLLALHSRAVANLTGLVVDPIASFSVNGLNDTTGFDSKNKIRARLNEERLVTVNNDANVSTVFGVAANTGDNEANQNTLGGSIDTGTIGAEVGINNLINQVVLAMGGTNDGLEAAGALVGDGIQIDAELINILTGAFSINKNDVESVYDLLAEINNKGVLDNIIDLLLNTGGNETNENTGGGELLTGAGCVDGSLHNNGNEYDLAGLGGWSLDIDNSADINNDFDVEATTGSNEANRNTVKASNEGGSGCGEEIALVSEPTAPEEPGVPEEPVILAGIGGSGDDGDQGSEDNERQRIAGVVDDKNDKGPFEREKESSVSSLLKRFPVAGGVGQALWLEGRDVSSMWPLFVVVSLLLLGAAWHFDHGFGYSRRWLLQGG